MSETVAGPVTEAAFPTADEIPVAWRHSPDETGRTLLIDGRLSRWDGAAEEIRSAVCVRDAQGGLEQVALGPAAAATAEVGCEALDAAVRAWAGGRGPWPRATSEERMRCVAEFLRRATQVRVQVARALMWEVGKPYADCLTEVDRTFHYIQETIETLRRIEHDADAAAVAGGYAARIRRAPLGVSLCLGPYNYAVNEVYTIVIPALIMGNPVVMKTPRYGVLANALLAPALAESFPPGVVNMVTGSGPTIIGPIMASGKVDVLALIGSARTADVLQKQHPRPYRMRSILGMGAKNAAIVLSDADLNLAASEIVSGALTFNGQRCTAIKLVLVARSVAEALVSRLSDRISALPVGMPWDDGVTITPMPDPNHPAKMQALVEDALGKGARVVNPAGGTWRGTLYRPALMYPVAPEAELFRYEQFGPVVPVAVFDQPEEALRAVETSSVGQQASVFGRDPKLLAAMVDHLTNLVCRVNINTQCRRGPDVFPFAGRKESAVGTLSLTDALRVFSIRSMVAVPEKAAPLLDDLRAHSSFLAPAPSGKSE